MRFGSLMVIVSDALSAMVKKGEITPRYYNPGDLFEEVHIVMTNRDVVNATDLQKTVGKARLYVHNVPLHDRVLLKTLGYRKFLLNRWANNGVALAKEIRPGLIRCHENSFNAFMAVRIRQELKVPVVISLHGNPDIDFRGPVARSILQKIVSYVHKAVEKPGLEFADYFVAVYEPIVPYLQANCVEHYSVIYNAVGYGARAKEDYSARTPVRFLCVGRQQSLFKDPSRVVQAFAELGNAELTMVGTGNLHDNLITLARNLNCEHRCRFIPSLPNEDVLDMMHKADVYVFNQITLGISKTIIEAALTGLPIIVNRRPRGVKDELNDDWLVQVDDTKAGYLEGMTRLAVDQRERERLGRMANSHARENWAPEAMERKVAELYLRMMQESRL